ncbi:30S ribosomal protein S1 [uncultured Ruminococcus sp.]|uniref:4-hydroxy-3-methylbut-2-enyl diphosphate reductase n=1 Tax=Massiliimalia timonensis TaxID=1987501 RepID=A0A8J6PBN2_9FIRM|nr:bifunctional 4-hydroxy-3-methylbut-2-enyl diphosphate reductase/30S ribosomal protein S1 [Massiliimalia timonensis]MBC8611167.1 bifunctional 4-hydroxy-3-methylbut-2-enyl diphosphate reductase/30S ribosomal protein S1 [Massiliimalia timonensis]SCI06838.1 30S ribosomal protein S1 [uncultured Clostridium sp.]SCI37999.1 30S ribosomal protein S1 [uncultured Ruminococcus sp.]
MKPTITVAKTAGFCFGVNRAVDLVYHLVEEVTSVKTLGPIIHNPQLVDDLSQKGVSILDSPQQARSGDTVVIRSHGVGQQVYEELERPGIHLVDATCPFVAKIHKIVAEHSAAGETIIIAGDKNHPEVLGIQGHCQGECYVVKDEQELLEVLKNIKKPAIMVAQTTFHANLWRKCVEIVKNLCTNLVFFDTICNATNERQAEAVLLAQQNDLMIVIGGKESSNTKKLKEVCAEFAETYLLETAEELDKLPPLCQYASIGVTAGASTPAYIIKEVLKTMSEMLNKQEGEMDFATLFEQSLESEKLYNGKRVKGIVTTIAPNEVHVDIGAKQAGIVPADELTDDPSQATSDVVSKGDEIELVVLKVNDQEGIVTLSKKRCDAVAGFEEIKKAAEDGTVLTGTVVNVVKGGVLVLSNHTKVFIPASQVSDKRVEDLNTLLKTEVQFKILEVNERRNRALGSVRAVLESDKKEKEEKFWSEVEVGKIYKGEVKSLTSYGAFVDLGGVDGMIHITELSWSKIKHPSEIVNVGDIVEVYVKDLDPEKRRISLGYKKSEDNPWEIFKRDYKIDDVVKVKIVSFTNYGAFAEIIPGIDGLIHISQIANQRVEKISDILEIGQEVEVKIIDINYDAKRVSLSMRALLPEEDQKIAKEGDSDVVYSSEDGVISEEMAAEIEAAVAEEE